MKAALILLACAAGPLVHAEECPRTPLHDFIERGQDLYLGEMHGTVETPELVRCLVVAAVARGKETVIVSLEQQPSARELHSEFWRGSDGRSSGAMWGITSFLIEQEKAGKLVLDHHLVSALEMPKDGEAFKWDPVAYERKIGTHLRELSARGHVIALSGNAHSRKEPAPGLDYDPAGKYAADAYVHVDVVARNGGAAWNCGPGNECGISRIPGNPGAGAPGALVDGKFTGHDYIYLVPKFTASPPQYQ